MPYSPQTWIDNNSSYPLSAVRMGVIETGIQTATTTADTASATAASALAGAVRVFTNEAARDAAIPSPVEGTRAYLTAPTIPAATGSLTIIPTGVHTVYNGSVWVCLTEVASTSVTNTNFNLTSTFSAGWTSGGGDTINNSVTLVTGTTAFVNLGLIVDNASSTTQVSLGVSVTGASSQSATNAYSVAGIVLASTAVGTGANGALIVTGLTAGTNTFNLLATNNAPTQTMRALRRFISVRGIA